MNSSVPAQIQRIEKSGNALFGNADILDVSRTGLALLLRDSEDQLLLQHDHLWIKKSNDLFLEKPFFGRVVYAHKRKYKDSPMDIKAGICLECPIPSKMFKELQQMSTLY